MQRVFALVVALVVIEVAVIIEVAHRLGVVDTIGLLLIVSAVGAVIVKVQGVAALRRAITDVETRRVPGVALADAALLAAAGGLLLVPGFITDVAGLLLLIPPVRHGVQRWLRRRWSKRFVVRTYQLDA